MRTWLDGQLSMLRAYFAYFLAQPESVTLQLAALRTST
jgi:hypothetical protein